jgi:hypothetical protein
VCTEAVARKSENKDLSGSLRRSRGACSNDPETIPGIAMASRFIGILSGNAVDLIGSVA